MELTTEQLRAAFPAARLIPDPGHAQIRFVGIAPLDTLLEDFLLVGNASRYNAGTQTGAFVLLEDVPAVPRMGDTLLLLPGTENICDVFTRLSALFRKEEARADARHALEQAVLFSSPREAVAAAADLLGTGLTLYNALGERIASSLPDAPRRIAGEELSGAFPFQTGGAPVAYLTGDLTGCAEEELRFVRKHLETTLRRYAAETPGLHFSTELLLERLLSGEVLSDANLHFYAGLCGWQADGSFCLLLADRAHLPADSALVAFINRVEDAADAGTYVTDRFVVFLFPADDPAGYEARLRGAEAVFAAEQCTAAASRIFTGLREVGSVFARLERLLPLLTVSGSRAVVPFDEAAYLLAVSGYRSLQDLHPLCRKLLELDQRGKFPCSETVYEYLLHAQIPADTCRALHIHRNTLDYRLGRLSELCHIDFTDGGEMASLLFSLYAARHLGLSSGTQTV